MASVPGRLLTCDAKWGPPADSDPVAVLSSSRRISKIMTYLLQPETLAQGRVEVVDFPWTAEEMASLREILRVANFAELRLVDPRREYCVPPDAQLPWPHLPRGEERIRAADPRLCVNGADISLPAHLYPRGDPRHDGFIPHHFPSRHTMMCVDPDEADGVLARLRLAQVDGNTQMQPVSLTRRDLLHDVSAASTRGFLASPKVDGTRYLVCFENARSSGAAYFVNRAQCVWKRLDVPKGRAADLDGTILDVECRPDSMTVFDALMVADSPASTCTTFLARLNAADRQIGALSGAWGTDQVVIRRQTFVPVAQYFGSGGGAGEDDDDGFDGVVLTPCRAPWNVYKFKPPSRNTLDVVNDGGLHGLGAIAGVPPALAATAIIEVRPAQPGVVDGPWIFVCERPDKTTPNPVWVRNRIIATMLEGITREHIAIAVCGPRG